MTKRKEHYERIDDASVDIGDELQEIPPLNEQRVNIMEQLHDVYKRNPLPPVEQMVSEVLKRLSESGVVEVVDSEIIWREGHLKHLAHEYVADLQRAWRDYADDLTVVFETDNAEFDALVAEARGE
jgi:hypothetical protein